MLDTIHRWSRNKSILSCECVRKKKNSSFLFYLLSPSHGRWWIFENKIILLCVFHISNPIAKKRKIKILVVVVFFNPKKKIRFFFFCDHYCSCPPLLSPPVFFFLTLCMRPKHPFFSKQEKTHTQPMATNCKKKKQFASLAFLRNWKHLRGDLYTKFVAFVLHSTTVFQKKKSSNCFSPSFFPPPLFFVRGGFGALLELLSVALTRVFFKNKNEKTKQKKDWNPRYGDGWSNEEQQCMYWGLIFFCF